MADDPSNAVLAERIAEVKEDIRELQMYVRHNIEQLQQQNVALVAKHAEVDVTVQKGHDAIVSLKAIVEYDRTQHAKAHDDAFTAHTKVHDDEHAWNRWVVGTFILAVTAAGSLGLGALIFR